MIHLCNFCTYDKETCPMKGKCDSLTRSEPDGRFISGCPEYNEDPDKLNTEELFE